MRKLVLALILIPVFCSAITSSVFAANPSSDQQLYDNAKRAINSGHYQEAIEQYNQLLQNYPASQFTDQSQLEIAYAYYKLGDSSAAINTLNQFLADNKDHPHIPYAHYLAGLAHYAVSMDLMESATTEAGKMHSTAEAGRALNHFSEIIDQYPGSQYVDDAKHKSSALLEKLALQRMSPGVATPKNQTVTQEAPIDSVGITKWLLEQPGSHFTLQLMRSSNLAQTQEIISQYGLQNKAVIFKTEGGDTDVYTLIYGIYPSKREAMEVGSSLPKAVLEAKPQVRELSGIQLEIREDRLLLASQGKQPATISSAAPVVTPQPKQDSQKTIIAISPIGKAYRENWLLQQNPAHYTIQISAMSQELGLNKFIDEKKLAGQVAYFRGIRQGKDWYSLLFGSYPDKQTAKQAVSLLKLDYKISDTWIRSFKEIHQAIQGANNVAAQ